MPLPRPARPRVLWSDLRAFWRDRPRHQWVAGTLAVLIPIGDRRSPSTSTRYTNIAPRETDHLSSTAGRADRTDEQIKAKQKADARARRAPQAERQRQFQRIDDRLKRLGHLSDAAWMDAAIALGERGRGRTAPNPNVGCVIVSGRRAGRPRLDPARRPAACRSGRARRGRRSGARRDRLCHARTLRP